MSEKNTDRYMQNKYVEVFKYEYHTEGNKELFNSNFPDGHDILNDKILIIIENKKLVKQLKEAKEQIKNYYTNLPTDIKEKYKIYLIIGLGNTEKTFKYKIFDNNLLELNKTLKDIYDELNEKPKFDITEIHKLNQYLYDNSINLPKSQKTLFIASVLICLKINKDFIKDYNETSNSYIIADKMIDTIQNYYDDIIFTNNFNFIKKSIHNKHLYHIFNVLSLDVKEYGKDILNQFYSEFCLWDKNNDASLGVVLTPHDIVELMVKELKLNENDEVIDFCTGTGSFLIESGKISNNLYGCENNEERYSLCKCNFILHDLDYSNLKYNSCFNENYKTNSFSKGIINPPFSCKCQDELNKNNLFGWKNFEEEQKFIMYLIELLKIGGIGACIVPRSNFNNSIKIINDFKKEILKYCRIIKIYNCNSKVFIPNANIECSIIIFEKVNNYNENNEIDNSNVEVIDYSDDGYKIKKKIRYYNHEPNLNNRQYKKLEYNNDWNYRKEFDLNLDNNKIIKMIENYNNNYQYGYNYNIINNKVYESINIEYIKYKLSDIIEPIKYKTYTYDKCEDGDIPFYVASQLNIPKGFKNVISIDCDKLKLKNILCINKSGEGVIGYCHLRTGKFGCNALVGCYKMKIDLTIPNLSLLQYQLINKFNHHFEHISLNDIKDTEIYLFKNEINYDDITKVKPIILYNNINQIIDNNLLLKNIDIYTNKIKVKLYDILEIIKVKTYQTDKSDFGNIPLYGAKQLNIPVKFINEYSINTYEYDDINIKLNGVLCINKTGDGGAGICHKRIGIFAINPSILICKMKYFINDLNCAYLSKQLHTFLNRSNTLSLNNFNEIEVYLIITNIN